MAFASKTAEFASTSSVAVQLVAGALAATEVALVAVNTPRTFHTILPVLEALVLQLAPEVPEGSEVVVAFKAASAEVVVLVEIVVDSVAALVVLAAADDTGSDISPMASVRPRELPLVHVAVEVALVVDATVTIDVVTVTVVEALQVPTWSLLVGIVAVIETATRIGLVIMTATVGMVAVTMVTIPASAITMATTTSEGSAASTEPQSICSSTPDGFVKRYFSFFSPFVNPSTANDKEQSFHLNSTIDHTGSSILPFTRVSIQFAKSPPRTNIVTSLSTGSFRHL